MKSLGYAIGAMLAAGVIGFVAGYVIERWSVVDAEYSYAPANLRGVKK